MYVSTVKINLQFGLLSLFVNVSRWITVAMQMSLRLMTFVSQKEGFTILYTCSFFISASWADPLLCDGCLSGCKGDSRQEMHPGKTSQDISYDGSINSPQRCRRTDTPQLLTTKHIATEAFPRTDIRKLKIMRQRKQNCTLVHHSRKYIELYFIFIN
jgi:hypothetical protein